jgi:hypothetical protein
LYEQLDKWEKYSEEKPSIQEILKITQVEDFIERMIHKRLYYKDEMVREYAIKAKRIVKILEKHDE